MSIEFVVKKLVKQGNSLRFTIPKELLDPNSGLSVFEKGAYVTVKMIGTPRKEVKHGDITIQEEPISFTARTTTSGGSTTIFIPKEIVERRKLLEEKREFLVELNLIGWG